MTQSKQEMDFEELETRSQISSCSRTSKLSVANSLALKARAKAEATRAELAFAKREAEMLKQQAILQASLHELRMEKAAAAAQAEAELLEAAAEEYEQGDPLQLSKNMLPQKPDEIHNVSTTVQNPVQYPGHLSYQSVITANSLNAVTTSPPNAKPSTSSHPPVRQPTMDSSGAQNYRNQGATPLSEISDYFLN